MLVEAVWRQRKRLLCAVGAALIAGVAGSVFDVGAGIDILLQWLASPIYSRIPLWLLALLTKDYAPFTFAALAFVGAYKVSSSGPATRAIDAVFPNYPPFLCDKEEGQDGEALVRLAGRLELVGRKAELGLLACFAESSEPILWWSIYGPLGSGKSRLTRHWMETLRKQGWDVGLLQPTVAAPPPNWRPRRHTLVLIDEASTRTGIWPFLLAVVRCAPRTRGKRVRILLVDRSEQTFPAEMRVGDRESLERSLYCTAGEKGRRALRVLGLEKDAARQLSRNVLDHELSEHQFRSIYAATRGNPLAMLIMLRGSGSNDLAEELSARCQAQIERAKSIAGQDGATILAIAAISGPVPTTGVLASIGNSVEEATLKELFSLHRTSFDEHIPFFEPELVGQEMALAVIGGRVKKDLLAEQIFALNATAASIRLAHMWRQRPEAIAAYAVAMDKTLPARLCPSLSLEGDAKAFFDQRVKGLIALEKARTARDAEPRPEHVERDLAVLHECAAVGDLTRMIELHEALMLRLEGWPGARSVALLRVKAIHETFISIIMAPLHTNDKHSWVQYRVLPDGRRITENRAAEDWSKYWEEYNPLRSFEELLRRLLLERNLYSDDQEVCEHIASALASGLIALFPYLFVSKTESEADDYLAMVNIIKAEMSNLSGEYPGSAAIVETLAMVKSGLIDTYVGYMERNSLADEYWNEVAALQEWLISLVRTGRYTDNRRLLVQVAVTNANLVSHYGHHAATLALGSDAESKIAAPTFLRKMAGALAQIRELWSRETIRNDVEISRQLARALDSYIGVHVRNAPFQTIGISKDKVHDEIEMALNEIHDLQGDLSSRPDHELARHEASALEQVSRWHASIATSDNAGDEEASAAWQRMGELHCQLQRLQRHPVCADDPVIALEGARAASSAVDSYGAGAIRATSAEKAGELWDKMMNSLTWLHATCQRPAFSDDLDIARQGARGAFQQTESCVFAWRSPRSLLGEKNVQQAAMVAERQLLSLHDRFDWDPDIALCLVGGLRNLVTCTTGPHETRTALIRQLAERFPVPEFQSLAAGLEAAPRRTIVT